MTQVQQHSHLVLLALSIVFVSFCTQMASCNNIFDHRYHTIQIVDRETMRGVPMVNLTTTNMVNYYTDSNGVVAFYEPGLMNTTVYFEVSSDGYEFESDPYGFRGIAVETISGKKTVAKIKRIQLAQRLYRITGEGIYRDSILTGEPIAGGAIPMQFAIEKYLINSQVMGLDSAMMCLYKSRIYMFFGDTLRPGYILGNFHATGAVINQSVFNIDYGLNITYFTTDEKSHMNAPFVKPIAPIAPLDQPTWIHDVVSLKDSQGQEFMFATYLKPAPFGNEGQHAHPESRGILIWNDSLQQFEKVADIIPYERDHIWPVDGGHALKLNDYTYFGQGYPMIRCRSVAEAYSELSKYEAFTCLKPGTTIPNGDISQVTLDRDPNTGQLIWAWKMNTSPLSITQLNELIKKGMIKKEEAYFLQLKSIDDPNEEVLAAAGSVSWNNYRKKYIMIAQQIPGKSSFMGEIWYSEATEPQGPFVFAKKIVTHKSRDFYNPLQHSLFDAEAGRIIYFEGTYVNTFDKAHPTPRYNYNQQMYKLDLSLINLPVQIYVHHSSYGRIYLLKKELSQEERSDLKCSSLIGKETFWAFDKSNDGTIPVYQCLSSSMLLTSTLFIDLPESILDTKRCHIAFYAFKGDVSDGSGAYQTLVVYNGKTEQEQQVTVFSNPTINISLL
jgi:hypothetical protein